MSDYPATLDVRPLTTWPGALTPPGRRERALFSATLRQTLSLLDRELYQLGARRPVLEVAIDPAQFRLDGRPRAQAKAEHPGVVLSLPQTDVGPLRYATDRFLTWQDNLRAIALALEALRKVDRYGITRRGEQYAGFRALPSGATPMPPPPDPSISVDEAARILLAAADEDPGDAHLVADDSVRQRALYRQAAKTAHPDRGGDRAAWDRLELAKRVLDEHGGGR